jgi:hypothetical protein
MLSPICSRGNSDGSTNSECGLINGGRSQQQRITTLYGLINGKLPQFFDGKEGVISGLYFNLEEDVFEFYASVKMQGGESWLSKT